MLHVSFGRASSSMAKEHSMMLHPHHSPEISSKCSLCFLPNLVNSSWLLALEMTQARAGRATSLGLLVFGSLACPVAHCDCILGRQVKAAALGHNLGVSYKLVACNLVGDFCHLFHLKSYNANTLEHMILFIFLLILCCAYSKISYNISEFNVMQK